MLPLNDSKLCITKAVECLQAAIDAAKDTISNDQEEALAHLYLELGSFQFTVVMNRRNHSTSTTAANNQDNDDQFLLLQAQEHLKKSMVSTKRMERASRMESTVVFNFYSFSLLQTSFIAIALFSSYPKHPNKSIVNVCKYSDCFTTLYYCPLYNILFYLTSNFIYFYK